MKDLDWGDVLADAQRMRDEYYHEWFMTFDRMDTPTLEQTRYHLGIAARATGFEASVDFLRMSDHILLTRIAHTLCEGCLNRYGCDMCNPPQFDMSDMYPGYDPQTDHYERFGRPELPNEY